MQAKRDVNPILIMPEYFQYGIKTDVATQVASLQPEQLQPDCASAYKKLSNPAGWCASKTGGK
jgi:hypothetical protein